MSQNGRKCVYCKSYLFEDDDIVYCPVCGAPHHRDCYSECGHCALESAHGTPEQYGERVCAADAERKAESDKDRVGRTCEYCGKICTSDTLFCPYCGKPLVDFDRAQAYPTGFVVQNGVIADPLGGVDPKTDIGGRSAAEVADYVRTNTRRYVPLFARFVKTRVKTAWNWAAFLVPSAWLGFRKCYTEMAAAIGCCLFAFLMYMPCCIQIQHYYALQPTDIDANALFSGAIKVITPMAWIMLAIGIAADLAIRIFMGMRGDSIYMNRMIQRMEKISASDEEDTAEALHNAGGVNVIVGMLLLFPSYYMLMYPMSVVARLLLTALGMI